jgi:hypothetical protein
MYIPAKINANLVRILQKYLLFLHLYFFVLSFSCAQNSTENLFIQKKEIQDSLILSGYWESQVDILADSQIQIQKGRPYLWKSIQVYEDKIPTNILFIERLTGDVADQFLLNKKLRDYVKTNYHEEGYPLAKANLSITNLNDNQIDATINIIPQNYILYDSIVIGGDSQSVNSTYLSNLLNIKYNEPFDIKSYKNIDDEINQLEYVRLSSSLNLKFANNKAKILLDLQKIKVNQFDAIIGLVPEGSTTNLTGQVDARLRNLFKRGVGLDVFWQKYSANSQVLRSNIQQSHAFRSPLGFNFGFQLLQEDSTFLQTDLQIGAQYPFWKSLQIGVSYQRLNNNTIRDFSEEEISNISPLRSSRINAVLFNVNWRNQITYPQLKNHVFAEVNFSIGNKHINNYSSLPLAWQNVPEISNTVNGGFKLHFQRVFGKRILIEAIPQFASIRNPALSQNDLLRLGGLQNLRGVDRNFFFTRYYGLINLNYRYFLDQKSSFFLLTDIAKLEPAIGWVYAAGAGVDIKSKNGWFRIIYAIGSQTRNMPDFSQGKVHFGYIAVF